MALEWKKIDAINCEEGYIQEYKVHPDNCPIPYDEDEKTLELDEEDRCICRREKRDFKNHKSEIMHSCPYLRGWQGPYFKIICSYPEKEDISQ